MKKNCLKDKYRIERKIAQGGMSSVYLCTNIELGNKWIMKHIDNKYMGLVYEEEILKKLYHVSLPQIIDIYKDATGLYIIETYIQGVSLQKLLELRESFTIEQTIDYALQLCDVLEYLHNRSPFGIIHKDIKPSNIIVTENDKLVLIDFGIAQEEGNQISQIAVGTSNYAPPEQFSQSHLCDSRGDIYSLGVVIFQMLTGKLSIGESMQYKSEFPIIYKKLIEITHICTAFLPENRYQKVSEIKKELQSIRDKLILSKEKRKIKNKMIFLMLIVFSAINYLCFFVGYLYRKKL